MCALFFHPPPCQQVLELVSPQVAWLPGKLVGDSDLPLILHSEASPCAAPVCLLHRKISRCAARELSCCKFSPCLQSDGCTALLGAPKIRCHKPWLAARLRKGLSRAAPAQRTGAAWPG